MDVFNFLEYTPIDPETALVNFLKFYFHEKLGTHTF